MVLSILFKFKFTEQKIKFPIKDFPFCAMALSSIHNKEALGNQMIAKRKPFDRILGFRKILLQKGLNNIINLRATSFD